MTVRPSIRPMQLLGAVALVIAAGCAQAQGLRRIGPATQPSAPVTTPGVATFGMPNPAGLPSPFPAGLPPTGTSPAGLPSPTVPNLASPGTAAPGSVAADAGLSVQTSVMGASAGGGVAVPRMSAGVGGGGRYAAVDIARSFIEADANRDGDLTRAEAQRLTILPYSFEEMDRNRDGLVSRFEYDDATR